ncbi:helix-turn-helix domain-containing protein [Yinghuangia sp. ASG 101]|uniref:helix-turn-helix domain-containing protein n=1 Tax=Yinghuangia sp. ASG 101 TaxID=2896848 RepID=UPI001E4ED64C|nr:helix-turn-helix domain-containing protein [Yinghuangia sp. ASG 101]UGQ11509.1 helix-turn-helix domain-containing protein [Yinghuangia sp. ASG 101]
MGAIFRLASAHADCSYSRLARLCEMTPSRVSQYAKGTMRVRDQRVFERVADGLRIPGGMLGLARRPWEVRTQTRSSNGRQDALHCSAGRFR